MILQKMPMIMKTLPRVMKTMTRMMAMLKKSIYFNCFRRAPPLHEHWGTGGSAGGARGEHIPGKKKEGGETYQVGELYQTFFLLFTLLGKRNVLNSLADLMVSVLGILIHHFMIALLKC